MWSFSAYDTSAHLGRHERDGTHEEGSAGGLAAMGRLLLVLVGFGTSLQARSASSEPAVCQSLSGAAQQVCGVAAAIPKGSDTPSSADGDAVRVVAPLSSDAFHAVPADRIEADPGSFLRRPIAVGPARCVISRSATTAAW